MNLEYDSLSPVTGNKCVLEEANEHDGSVSYLCMESGFTSHEQLIDGSDFQEKYEERLTDLMEMESGASRSYRRRRTIEVSGYRTRGSLSHV